MSSEPGVSTHTSSLSQPRLASAHCLMPLSHFVPRTKSGRALSSSRRKSKMWPSLEPVHLRWIDLYDEPEVAGSRLILQPFAQWAEAPDFRPEFPGDMFGRRKHTSCLSTFPCPRGPVHTKHTHTHTVNKTQRSLGRLSPVYLMSQLGMSSQLLGCAGVKQGFWRSA